MSDLTRKIQQAQREAAEQAVVDSIPRELLDVLDAAQARHEQAGGCPGCGSMTFAVHNIPCPVAAADPF